MGWRRMDRRRFLMGVGAGAAALGLAGCGVDFSQKRTAGQEASKVKGDFSWTREKGKTVNVLFAQHPMADSFIVELPSFKKKTGITLKYDTLPEEEFFQKLRTDLSTGEGNYDAFIVQTVLEPGIAGLLALGALGLALRRRAAGR